MTRANVLLATGHRDEAIAILELRVHDAPDDGIARQTLLSARIAALEEEIRTILAAQAKAKEQVIGDPDYEDARARANLAVNKRLNIAEYYAQNKRYPEAVVTCNAILKDYPHDTATLKLKYRVLQTMVEQERDELDKEKALRHEDAINDVIEAATMPGELPRAKRQVFVFDEDISEIERQAVLKRLREARISLTYDSHDQETKDTKSTTLSEVLPALFALAKLNYVLLDSSLSTEPITISMRDETVENILAVLAKLVNIHFNYSGGTVFISSATSTVLQTEIIRLHAGLTDVVTDPKLPDIGGGGGGGGGGAGGQGQQILPGQPAPAGGGLFGGQGGGGGGGAGGGQGQNQPFVSDLERFLAKVPDIVVDWPAEGKISFEPKSNTVYIKSTPASIAEVKRLLQALDYNNTQVLIEARFIEVSDDAAKELGIDWEGGGNRGDTFVSAPTTGLALPTTATGGATIGTGGGTVSGLTATGSGLLAQVLVAPSDFLKFKATISALQSEGKADTLSEPKILTLNNGQGIIEILQDISYISSYQNIGVNSNYVPGTTNNGINNAGYVNTSTIVPVFTKDSEGIRLQFRPSVARNSDIITLTVAPVVRELTKPPQTFTFNNSNGNSTGAPVQNSIQSPPEFDTRRLITALHVKNGGTVVLGGLSREKELTNTTGVPWFSKVPVIGQLFRRDSHLNQRSNLLIFITAHIVDPTGAHEGDDVRLLRDTYQKVYPSQVQQADANQKADEAKAAIPPPDSPPEAKPIWRRDPRR